MSNIIVAYNKLASTWRYVKPNSTELYFAIECSTHVFKFKKEVWDSAHSSIFTHYQYLPGNLIVFASYL